MSFNLILFDDAQRGQLLPLVFTRPVCDLRLGILTIREKWEKRLNTSSSTLTEAYLSRKFPAVQGEDNLFVNGAICPDEELVVAVSELQVGQLLMKEDLLIAARTDSPADHPLKGLGKPVYYEGEVTHASRLWHIFQHNHSELERDFELLTAGRQTAPPSITNTLIGGRYFIEEGARVEASVLNSNEGPIYIGKSSEVMEGCLIRGPFALGDHAVLKMGAKIYGASTIGPNSKAGGEINNSVIIGYSNKAHDGFLGNAVIGEWCNLGADTNNSNLKNNYSNVKVWDYTTNEYVSSGTQFCGLFMADHSKCGINTMFNTGTVAGVSANIFGAGFPATHIPSYTWGGVGSSKEYNIDVAVKVARSVMSRRHIDLDDASESILRHVFEMTRAHRENALAQ